MNKKLFCVLLLCALFASLLSAQQICASQSGQNGGYYYEHWTDGGGTACMTLGSEGSFSVSWQNCNNFVSRKGKSYDDSQTYQQLGGITINFACNYNPNGNSYLCVYGWTHNPLIEFYVVESFGTWEPPGSSATSKGTITVDGSTYKVYTSERVDQPSIEGTKTFTQFWSVRSSKRTSGSVSVTDHFNAWANMGMTLGKFHECSMAVEGYQSSGDANMTSMSFGGSVTTAAPVATPTSAPTAVVTAAPGNLGDCNNDGSINIVDALLVAQFYVGLNPANFIQANADSNRDGSINIVDALLIAQCYVGLRSCTF
jgi:endo-1,4-beta-xylanase